MLAIRLQRVGRKGLPQYRIVVQESQLSPKSGKVVKHLGHYNPHTKEVKIDTETAQKFLDNGAQPSERAAKLMQDQGVKLPKWFSFSKPGNRTTRNPDKLRKNQPAEEKPAEVASEEAPAAEEETKPETESKDEPATSEPAEQKEASEEESPEKDAAEEKPAEQDKSDKKSE